ncbi:TonB-system energizer ExbB [Desulfobulbus sp.]|uniref:TonB-system energizer ExbB n=1 Tax=Desulfobulbus sp. TaxID=895 RepID=UPI0035A0B9DD
MDWMNELHNIVDYGVLGLLLLLSVAAVSLALERFLVYRVVRIETFADRRELELHLTHKLHLIATIGANAPYIGLLGTVLGIMLTFYDIGTAGFDTTKIMQGLALALKATALGLLVAIPAVTLYNLLLRKCKVLLMQWDIRDGRKGI